MTNDRAVWIVPAMVLTGILLIAAQCYAASPKVVAIEGDYGSTAFLMDDGSVWTCGNNEYGQLGIGSTEVSSYPVKVPIGNVKAITGMQSIFLALKYDGTVWAWGTNGYMCLSSDAGDILTPVRIPEFDNATAINGDTALKADGTVWQLSTRSQGNYRPPRQIGGLNDIVAIGDEVALKGDSTVWTWFQREDAVQFSNLKNIKAINGDLALGQDGSVWMLFANANGTAEDLYSSDVVATQANIHGVTAISSLLGFLGDTDDYGNPTSKDFSHNFAIDSNGSLWAWGCNAYGDLGNGYARPFRDYRLEPEKLPVDGNIIVVSTEYAHSLALTADGTVLAWGDNGKGQRGSVNYSPASGYYVGNDTFFPSLLPSWVPVVDHVTAIMTSDERCYAVKDDGTVWAWGLNDMGQLGVGTITYLMPGTLCSGGLAAPTRVFFGTEAIAPDQAADVATTPAGDMPAAALNGTMPVENATNVTASTAGLLEASATESTTDADASVNQTDMPLTAAPSPTMQNSTPYDSGNSGAGGIVKMISDFFTAIVDMIPV